MSSYIGKCGKADGRMLHDRQRGRSNEQDFIARERKGKIRLIPEMSTETRACILQAISEAEMFGYPWEGVINDLRIQIYNVVK